MESFKDEKSFKNKKNLSKAELQLIRHMKAGKLLQTLLLINIYDVLVIKDTEKDNVCHVRDDNLKIFQREGCIDLDRLSVNS